jgi:hypothetical protein
VNASPLRVSTRQALHGNTMTSEVAVHEAGHVLVGLKTGRKLLQV